MPAYVIAHDTTLAAIAEARPTDARRAPPGQGHGPAKLERYGEEILAVIERLGAGMTEPRAMPGAPTGRTVAVS